MDRIKNVVISAFLVITGLCSPLSGFEYNDFGATEVEYYGYPDDYYYYCGPYEYPYYPWCDYPYSCPCFGYAFYESSYYPYGEGCGPATSIRIYSGKGRWCRDY